MLSRWHISVALIGYVLILTWLSPDFIDVTGIRKLGLTWILLVQQASGGQPWAGQWISCGRLRAAGCAPGDIEGRRFGAGEIWRGKLKKVEYLEISTVGRVLSKHLLLLL